MWKHEDASFLTKYRDVVQTLVVLQLIQKVSLHRPEILSEGFLGVPRSFQDNAGIAL
jgi:hypothetical protein